MEMYAPQRSPQNNFGSYYGDPLTLALSNLLLTLDLADLGLLPELWETSSQELVEREKHRVSPMKQPPSSVQPMFHLLSLSLLWLTPTLTPQPAVIEGGPRPFINPGTIYTYTYYDTVLTEDKHEELPQLLHPMAHQRPPLFSTLLTGTKSPPTQVPLAPPQQPPQQILAQKPILNTQLYKTELCSQFVKMGLCPYGNKCQFAHGENELKRVERPSNWRLKPCLNWQKTGTCRYGSRCLFKHG